MKTAEELVKLSSTVEGQGVEDHPNCTYTSQELRVIADVLVQIPHGGRVVEIGVYSGRSTSLYLQLQEELNLDIHLIDKWCWDVERAMRQFTQMIINPAYGFDEVPFTLHKMRSDFLGKKWNLPIDFLHIDGCHDGPDVDEDFRLWLPSVVPGGFVACHDIDYPPVAACVERCLASQGWEFCGTAWRAVAWRKPLS
jgi:predicted O-methyltransferase YrrM